MKELTMNPSNKKYYSAEYIKGWEDGVNAQYEADIDAVEIIRCRKCKYWKEGKCWNMKGLNKTDGIVNADDFCSYGKRREDGEE